MHRSIVRQIGQAWLLASGVLGATAGVGAAQMPGVPGQPVLLGGIAAPQGTQVTPSSVGMDDIVLPGFAPLQVSGTRVNLGSARSYVWNGSFLPVEIDAVGSPIVAAMNLRLRVAGSSVLLGAAQVSVLESTATHAVIRAQGQPYPNLLVTVTTNVEYDGVAMATVAITPSGVVTIDGLDQEVDVYTTRFTRALMFDANNVNVQPRTQQINPSYSGSFLNAVDLADGNRSFWWFADNARGWIWNGPTVTELAPIAGNIVRLTQHLIGSSYQISAPMQFQFNFLATPVRDMGSSWRTERVTAGVGQPERGLGTVLLGWYTAFIHYDLPYTSYPPGIKAQIPAADLAAYPGLQANKTLMDTEFTGDRIQLLPYLSLHCLTQIDPGLVANRSAWAIDPPDILTGSDPPWTAPFVKPVLSHRATSFSDYLVSRLAAEIDNLGMRGLYFDQATIVPSNNPANGAWIDSQGRTQASLDILGTRSFLKRLRTVFAEKGNPGYVFVHASNSELIPAFTFATAIVDGEQFTTSPSNLRNDDYIGSISLDQTRIQFSPDQYGVRSVWLPEFSYFHPSAWTSTTAGLQAVRNFWTLALLHDAEVFPSDIPYQPRQQLLLALDAFGTSQAKFVGYWQGDSSARSLSPSSQVSFYRRSSPTKLLLVVANLAATAQTVGVALDPVAMGFTAAGRSPVVTLVPSGQQLPTPGGVIQVPLAARDFQLVSVQ
jgi:hypothetical protein